MKIRNPLIVGLFVIIFLLFNTCTPFSNKKNAGGDTKEEKDLPKTSVVKGDIELVEREDIEGNIEKFAILTASGNRHGKFVRLSAEKVVLEEATYQDGKLDGLRVLYFPNRDTQVVETHKMGIFHGPFRTFHEGNQVKLEGHYIDNRIEGIWFQYYPTGELMEEVNFVDNQENGPFKEYHKNGQISVTGQYKDGDNEHGELKFYSEDGVHTKTMDCDMGMCRTIWTLEEESL